MKPDDLTGQVFGRLVVVSRYGRERGSLKWTCLCNCGTECNVSGHKLKTGHTKSCGCLARETNRTTHGMTGTKEYRTWAQIIQRCTNSSTQYYYLYGGRGITVCDEWRNSFETFYKDMGEHPGLGYSIDRIDSNKGYCKDNCRWATTKEQTRNTRRNNILEYNGEKYVASDLATKMGIARALMNHRIYKLGWTVEQAVETPVKKMPPRRQKNGI